jgi:peptidyl-prolyl cis-trans isomerase SurA
MGLCRNKIVMGLVLFCLPLLAFSEQAVPERFMVDGVAAYVNEHTVTIGDVMAALQPLQRRLIELYEGERLKEELRKAYVMTRSSLIDKYLILDFYEKQEMQIPDWIVDERVDRIVHERFKGDRTELLGALSQEGLTYDDWEKEIRNQIIVSLMQSTKVDQNVRVSPGSVRRELARGADEYKIPGKVRLRMIVVKQDSKDGPSRLEKAEGIRQRLLAGEDFGELAKSLSDGDRAAEGGDWGWIEPKMLRRELAQAVTDLGVNEVSRVIDGKDEAYILKVEDRKEPRVPNLDEVRQQIEMKLRREEAERLYKSWIDRLKQHAYVKVLNEQSFQ